MAHQYFEEKIPVSLSYVQASVLLCLGLQESEFSSIEVMCLTLFCFIMVHHIMLRKRANTFEYLILQRQMQLERGQIHSLLLKVSRELYKYLNGIAAKEIEVARPRLQRVTPYCFLFSVIDPSNNVHKKHIFRTENSVWIFFAIALCAT